MCFAGISMSWQPTHALQPVIKRRCHRHIHRIRSDLLLLLTIIAVHQLDWRVHGLSAPKTSSSYFEGKRVLAPETSSSQRLQVEKLVEQVFGNHEEDGVGNLESESTTWQDRKTQAIDVSTSDGERLQLPQHQTVYGELGTSTLATILDAAGVYSDDVFLDIGSGDGVLVASAALLYPDFLSLSRGVEILPSLYERSLEFQQKWENMKSRGIIGTCSPTELLLGDVYNPDEDLQEILAETTLSVCFATTWSFDTIKDSNSSSGGPNRKVLPQLSRSLASNMRKDARVIIIDGHLETQDPLPVFRFEGELKIQCPDTAPYSMARLYTKLK